MTRPNTGPYPNPGFAKQVSSVVLQPLVVNFSGEVTTHKTGFPIGAPRVAGYISNVYLSVGRVGKDDSNTLSLAGNVYINGTTCLTTEPAIAHVSGEAAATQKTTVVEGDTGITQAVLASTNTFNPGDVITGNLTLTRTASPSTEMANVCIVVELMPNQ